MKYFLALVISCLILGGCSLSPQRSGVEIMSTPPAKVYINSKEAGMTPYKNNNLKPGDVAIKLVTTEGVSWEKEVRLENYSDTVVDWDFGEFSSGYVLTLEKTDSQKAGLLVNVTPASAAIAIDGEIKGFSPLRIEDIGEGDKQITLSYPGYKSKTIYPKGIIGYQLVVEAQLAQNTSVTEEIAEPIVNASESAQLAEQIQIKATETGWLRVRDTPSKDGKEIGRVKPGEKYQLLEENTEWVKIKISDSLSGWISLAYALKAKAVNP